jgi:hypothetical protein
MSAPASLASSTMRNAVRASPPRIASTSPRAYCLPVAPNAASTVAASTAPPAYEATCSSIVNASRKPPSARYAMAPSAPSSIAIPSASAISRMRAIMTATGIRRNA